MGGIRTNGSNLDNLRACCITSLSGWTGAIFNIYELHDQHLRVF
jgi:hypothetical protein